MKLSYILHLADDALVLGHRMSEWCGHGPVLEQDIAMTNTALDLLGRARTLYQYAADLYNQMPVEQRAKMFSSVSLQKLDAAGEKAEEDTMPYLRDSWDFKNVLIAEQPNGDWAQSVARSLFVDCFYYYYFDQLQHCTDATIAAVAEKSLKEVTYHLKWSSEWVIRLGDGTDESHEKMQTAINELWSYTGEMFEEADYETSLRDELKLPELAAIKAKWQKHIEEVLEDATMKLPTATWMQKGGKNGMHSEHLGYVLAELQFMQRVYPSMQW